MILNHAAVDACTVPDRHIVSDDARIVVRNVQTGKILDIGADPDGDIVHITACDDPRPEARVLTDAHIAGEKHLRRNERLLVNLRCDAMKRRESVSFERKHKRPF